MAVNTYKRTLETGAASRCAVTILLFCLLLALGSSCLGQQPPCTVAVVVQRFDLSSFPKEYLDKAVAWRQESRGRSPAKPGLLNMGEWGYATTDDWTVARDVPPEAFVVREGRHIVRFQSVRMNFGPRRVVFVADDGKEVNAPGRKIEATVITGILSKARAGDSFALLTARGPRVALRLGSRRETIEAAAEKLGAPAGGQSDGEGVLDALLEASTWLQPPRPGDSIFLVAMHLEGRNKTGVSRVRKALETGRIRLFGFQLGPKGSPGVGDVVARSFARSSTSGEWTDGMFPLSRGTGGATAWENTEDHWYALRETRLQRLADIAGQMYNAITGYYVLELSSVTPDLSIRLSPEFQKPLLVPMDVLYPRDLPPCKSK